MALFRGDANNNFLRGTSEDDRIVGFEGNDTLIGGSGDDALFGRTQNDVIRDNSGNDFIKGGAGADTIINGTGDDQIDGGAGNDTIIDGSGNDLILGSAGSDKFIFDFDRDGDVNTIRGFFAGVDVLDIPDGPDVQRTFGSSSDGDLLLTYSNGIESVAIEIEAIVGNQEDITDSII